MRRPNGPSLGQRAANYLGYPQHRRDRWYWVAVAVAVVFFVYGFINWLLH